MNTQKNSFVSVIIPNRNRDAKLVRSVKSAATQTYHNVELVIVDDGSDQRIDYDAIKRMWNDIRPPNLLKIIHQQHSNANVARNRGADEAIGEFLIFLDSDDLLAPWAIETRLKFSLENKGIICGNAECFNSTLGDLKKIWNLPIDKNPLDRMLNLDFPWPISGPIWPKDVFFKVGKFNEELPSWQDWELFIRAVVSGITFIPFSTCDHFINISGNDKTSTNQYSNIYHLKIGILTMGRIESLLYKYQLANKERIDKLQIIESCLTRCLIENHGYKIAMKALKEIPKAKASNLKKKLFQHRLSKKLPVYFQQKVMKKIWGKASDLNDSDKLILKFSIPDLLASSRLKY